MKIFTVILSVIITISFAQCIAYDHEACVTVHTSSGTYTVDPSGCVHEPEIDITEFIER